ncbi:succinate dehydrogenase [Bordetella pertussis]|nr:succinate dehydrogenase [Bordetella pertussis]
MSVHLSGAGLPAAVDVVVIGSGASGMATAVTAAFHGAQVVVLEKADKFGGTTARSGGWLWIPGMPLATALGIDEPAGAARDYIAHEATTHFDAARTQAFLENGGQAGGRSMVTRPYDGRELGQAIAHLAPALPELMVLGMMLASGDEIRHFTRAFRSLASFRYVAARLLRQARDVLRHGRGITLTNGNALAARLARSALDLDVPIHLRCRVRSLLVENGRVAGVRVTPRRANARCAPAAAWCWPAAAFRTISHASRRCFRMSRAARGITRRHPPATPATAWRWPRRWACGWTQRFRTPRPGRRCRGPRAATANKA